MPKPHAIGESVGIVGNPVKAALKAPTLSIDCSTSLPLMSNLDPLVISIGIALPLPS